jgi:mono/diheme cytochrome c family protein
LLLFAGLSLPAGAAEPQPKPFAEGNAELGKAIATRDCDACHARQFGGDPARIYLRPEHKVKTPTQLLSQVRVCNTQLGTHYFPEEEAHVAAYLNLHFYKFRP